MDMSGCSWILINASLWKEMQGTFKSGCHQGNEVNQVVLMDFHGDVYVIHGYSWIFMVSNG